MRTPEALHVRITDNVAALSGLLERLEQELPEKRKNPHGGYGSGKGGHHPLAAWNGAVAMLVLEIHAGLRETEANIRYRLAGVVRTRGGSDANTRKILEGLPSLVAGLDYAGAQNVLRLLDSWIARASLLLGDAEPLSRLPRLPGQSDPKCPFCQTAGSLRVRHATGAIACIRPTCRDSAGNRPAGRIEIGKFSAMPLIAWSDGSSGLAGVA